MAQVINFNTPEGVKNAAQQVTEKIDARRQERNSFFENYLKQIEEINPALGGFEEFSALLSLPDEHFALVSSIFLEELEKSFNNVEDKLLLVQTVNVQGLKLEDLQETYTKLIEQIDDQLAGTISEIKRDFLKQMLGITYNCIADAQGIAKRVINIPIELTSENAKIPQYAHLGDGAVDLYSPADYTINPGETIIIPCDIKVALPYGYAFLIHPRSGTSAKTKLRVANSIGLVDSQYKGVIGVIVENIEPRIKDIDSEYDDNGHLVVKSIEYGKPFYISKGERFAQMRLVEVPTANFYQVQSVDGIGDDRGGGFGSSGIN